MTCPVTVITQVRRLEGKVIVRGTTTDNGTVALVLVNGREVLRHQWRLLDWEVELADRTGDLRLLPAEAEDVAANVEKTPHVLIVD